MKKNKKKFDYNYLLIIIFCAIMAYLIIPINSTFGSKIDWMSQHIVFPDYFRQLFYQTKNFFPSLAFSIGAGQNIYNFSYYGLFNPLLSFSVFLPFIKMETYIIVLNISLYVFFGCILYYFLKTKSTQKISLLSTLITLLAAPILFHFHRHFMFVAYLPFLVLALMGIDKYYEKKDRRLLCFSTLMIILISYYYAIPTIGVIGIYAIYRYLQINKKIDLKDMAFTGIKLIIPIFIAILISGVLLLPTYYVLKIGRSETVETINYISRFIPRFNLEAILYDSYSMGLTIISLLSLLHLFTTKKKEDLFLSITILIILIMPMFCYLLNGNLYYRNKVFIPFIPIFSLLLSKYLDLLINRKINLKEIVITILVVSILCIAFSFKFTAIYLDLLLVLLIIYAYYKDYTNKKMFAVSLMIVPAFTLYIANYNESYFRDDKKLNSVNMYQEINETLKDESDIVRFNNLGDTLKDVNKIYNVNYNQDSLYSSVSNPLYKKFYEDIFKNALPYRNNLVLAQNNDILFQTFMGVKYIYSKNKVPIGYQKYKGNVYKNDNVLPIFYGTSKVTNEEEFDKLVYPENITKLLNSVVVKDEDTKNQKITPIKKVRLNYKETSRKNIETEQKEGYYEIRSLKNNSKIELSLDQSINNDILIINIELQERSSCKEGDLKLQINDISNVLTCNEWQYKNNNMIFHYVISENKPIDKLKVKFDKGTYKIKNIDIYQLSYSELSNIKDYNSTFIVDKEKSIGDNIEGTINMYKDGYFVTIIPYDEGFKVLVDDKEVKTTIVNKAFLGFKLKEGNHNIKITYKAPFQKEGLILSMIGVIAFIILIIVDKKKIHD